MLVNYIRLKLRRCNNNLNNFKNFYRYISDDIKEEIVTHSYNKKEYEKNIDISEQCKSYIDLKQKIFYDYLSKKTLTFIKKKTIKDSKKNNDDKKKLIENGSLIDYINKEKEICENDENLSVEYLSEYKKLNKILNKNGKIEDEKNKTTISNEKIKKKDGMTLKKIGKEKINKDTKKNIKKSYCEEIKRDDIYVNNNEIKNVKKCETPNEIFLSINNSPNTISNDLINIYIDNSKYFTFYDEQKEIKEMKLNQYCSHYGICSSRFAFKNLKNGILKVNDKIIYENVNVCLHKDKIELTKRGEELLKNKITIIINKPKNYLSLSTDIKSNKKLLVRNLIRNENKYVEEDHKCMSYFIYKNVNIEKVNNLYVCGRLDANSSGLLIYTQNTLSHNYLLNKYKYKIEKEYIITTHNEIKEINLKLLRQNLYIDGKLIYKCHIKYIDGFTLIFKLYQGFHKIIRKICLLSNIKIKSLHRVKIGNIHLNNLPTGKWRFLMPNESFF
ncbi:RNA pseudouridylate synthase, putative [Plasmodium gallinaceum]|uniref:RNA pseudouridylate synthase, putative n=1 Tax=Plasmodium gallinaceum TaxID=5849 RepID=A0A1J1GQL9_PLAGA|nr:RNA pseudouridylate synthase, putative [Plasmodium gallinaceum]CRG93583.1 RNA pseudouridylate synthase, putative [Plasmodium gallinaceum]